jgi:hypothetical protein
MQKIAGFFRFYTHFYQKEQHYAALTQWRNGLLFLFVLALYSAILPWWSIKNYFWQEYNNNLIPIINQLPEIQGSEGKLVIQQENIFKSIDGPGTIQTTKSFSYGDKIEHSITISPELVILSQGLYTIPILIEPYIREKESKSQAFQLKQFLSYSTEFSKRISLIIFIYSIGSMFTQTFIQCAFISGLFYFLNKKMVRAPFIDFLKLSILSSIPFMISYALFIFYNHQSIMATLVPTILHFIFFFRSISSLIEFQNNRAIK